MRRIVIAVAAFLTAGCATLLDDAYDDRARGDCDRNARDKAGCYDAVDQHRRERDRDR
ncbi:MAG: hypothetical protein NW200_05570 [Hyphomonadaceae bacterium]|nr:hypothetical protein [Hyphomonadaceae bacterium]